MKNRVDRLVRFLADDFQVRLPPQMAHAELSRYLTTCSSVFRVSRLDARRYVTDEMLRASARELAIAYQR